LSGGEVALEFAGHVAWRYPEGAVPPGREAGVGLLVDAIDDDGRALLDRMRGAEDAGARAQAPGTRLGALRLRADDEPPTTAGDGAVPLDEAEASTAVGDETREGPAAEAEATEVDEAATAADAAEAEADDKDDGGETETEAAHGHAAPADEITSPTTAVEEVSGPLQEAGHKPAPRPLPDPMGFPPNPVPLPDAYGVAYQYAKTATTPLDVMNPEAFAWPRVGSWRPQKADIRTHVPGDEAGEDVDAEEWSDAGGWDEETDSDRVTAPTFGGPPQASPIGEDEEDETTETDIERTLSSDEGEVVVTLPRELLAGEHGFDAETLFAADTPLPTSTLHVVRASETSGRGELVLLEKGEGASRTIGHARWTIPEGQKSVEVQIEIGADGWVTVWRVGDDEEKKRYATALVEDHEDAPAAGGGFFGWLKRVFG
jgi:hypothetical protein